VQRITRQLHQCRTDGFRFWLAALLSLASLLASGSSADAQDAATAPAKREAPQELQIEKELVTEVEITDWRKTSRNNFSNDINAGKLNSTTQPRISEGVRMLVHELSLKARRDTISEVRKKVIRDTDLAKGQQMREFVMSEIVKRAAELLDGNLHVRMQAVLLIGELNVDPGQFPRKPPIAYAQGAATLIDVVDPPQGAIAQPASVRVLAAGSIARLLREGRQSLPPNQKLTLDIAPRLLRQLKLRNHQWYTNRLMDALVETGLTTVADEGNVPRPLIVEALARLMAEPQQPYAVRTHAMYCLGRAPMPGGINAAPIGWAASQLAAQIATDINQGKISGVRGFFLLQTVYYGYKPKDANEMTTDGRGKAGLTNSLAGGPVQAAYRDFLALFNGILKQASQGSQIIAAPQAIQTLRQVQKPADTTISSGGPSIEQPMTPNQPTNQAANAQNPPANPGVTPNAG
jgi:hypothetical protein